jgi:hypothetical protein
MPLAKAVIHRLPKAVVRVRARVRHFWICGRQRSTGASFLRVFRLPLTDPIPRSVHSHHHHHHHHHHHLGLVQEAK